MKVTALVENTSTVGFPVEHGLSLYIQMADGQNLLFDMGQGHLFAENAQQLGLNISDIDTAIISHGHYDHGGGLKTFLELNSKANIYIHQQAFRPHYSLRDTGMAYIGLDKDLKDNPRLIFCGDKAEISPNATLFAGVGGNCCRPRGNRLLFEGQDTNDPFGHEQNLLLEENGHTVLLAGCAHNGIVNILRRSEAVTGKIPTHVLAGMHLVKSGLTEAEEDAFIATLAHELMAYKNCHFYTMHCTGTEQFLKLKKLMGRQIDYLSCGEQVEIG